MVISSSTNLLNTSKFIVDPVVGNGMYTTIQSAINAASSGTDIFIRPGTYTENLSLKPGVNLVGFPGDSESQLVVILGTCTYAGGGLATISNCVLQTNGANSVVFSGSSAGTLTLSRCNLLCTNNTGISFVNSNGSSNFMIDHCTGDLQTTGIAYWTIASPGRLQCGYSVLTNSGNSVSPSDVTTGQVGAFHCVFEGSFSTSGTSGGINISYSSCGSNFLNNTPLAINATGGNSTVFKTLFKGNTAPAITIGAGATLIATSTLLITTNVNSITGAGTLFYDLLELEGGGPTNVSIQSAFTVQTGNLYSTGISFDSGSNTLSNYAVGTWTPVLTFGGSSTGITYSVQNGSYTRIGNFVRCTFAIELTSKGAQVGQALITGLPFTVNGSNDTSACRNDSITYTAGYTYCVIQALVAGTTAQPYQQGSNQISAPLTDVTFANNSVLQGDIFITL